MSFESIYVERYGELPPTLVTWGESDADILSQGLGFMNAFQWTMQLQVGCPGACQYCYVKSAPRLTPTSVRGPGGKTWGFVVRNKKDIGKKLRKHLQKRSLGDTTIYWSGVTDPYAALPPMTREVWETLIDSPIDLRPRRIAVQTRFRPDRDAALMTEYARSFTPTDGGPPVIVSYSVGTDRDDIIRDWERTTPLFEQRVKAISALLDAGIPVVATLSPLAPWADLRGTLRRFKSMGVSYVTSLFFKECTRSANTSSDFLTILRRHHPEVLDPRWQADRVAEMREVYGDKVLLGQEGFASLANPMPILARS